MALQKARHAAMYSEVRQMNIAVMKNFT